MSATKAITSSALWLLIQEGKISPTDMIVKYVPEYGTNDKESTTIEHLLIHTAGIPAAPGSFKDWGDRTRRLERFAQWRPVNPPGEKFIYHIHANYWPIGDAIERITGKRLGEFVRERIAEPLGLPDLRIRTSTSDPTSHGRCEVGRRTRIAASRCPGFRALEDSRPRLGGAWRLQHNDALFFEVAPRKSSA
jgi:CubicO group peptidase (beta-lactamase class C family)